MALITLALFAAGCPFDRTRQSTGQRIYFTQIDPAQSVSLRSDKYQSVAARNETIGFAVTLNRSNDDDRFAIRFRRLRSADGKASIAPSNVSISQVLDLPVDLNHAAVVRQTNAPSAPRDLPRALLPIPTRDGTVNLSALRNTGATYTLWVDLKIPADAVPGPYSSAADLVDRESDVPLSSAPCQFEILNLTLPRERSLQMVARLDWNDLARLWPERFEAITPRLLNRTEGQYASAVRTIDQLVTLAQAHRLNLVVPKITPTVKWPTGANPAIDWKDYDSLIRPWLTGDAFPDRVGLNYWPLPEPEYLSNFDPASRAAFWRSAATHFDQWDLLPKTSVYIAPPKPGRVNSANAILLSAEAGLVLSAHPNIKAVVPLELDQIQLANDNAPNLVPANATDRLLAVGAPLVNTFPTRWWPTELPRPGAWLRTDLPGVQPHLGLTSTESAVRTWAYLAILRGASAIHWPNPAPAKASNDYADESEFPWFYPGESFGVNGPLPSIQLKYLRRAQQDFEYLRLAQQQGPDQFNSTLALARLACRPVELSAEQMPDPVYALMTGSANPLVWTELQKLIAQSISLHAKSKPDAHELNALEIAKLRWSDSQARTLVTPRTSVWLWDTIARRAAGNFIDVKIGLDLSNSFTPNRKETERDTIQWSALPAGWVVKPQAQSVPPVGQFNIRRMIVDGRFDLDKLQPGSRRTIELAYTTSYTGRISRIQFSLPLAISYRREARLNVDGSLEDWDPDDSLQSGPMVKMFSWPTVQDQTMQLTQTNANVYSNWSDESFYLGFKLEGAQRTSVQSMRNFVNYDLRRAWGEDLCEILMQPLYVDNSAGPILHLIFKPGGQWIERKLDPKFHADPWQPVEGAAVKYASTLDASIWRGELAIPWKIIEDPNKGRPTLLRFNFVQHKNATGESSSWAGPVDHGRDENWMGLLHLREPNTPGMK